jgi:protein SCO1
VEDRLMRADVAPAPRRLEVEEAQALGGLVALFVITASWWALALWPVADGPAWLERTRYVCFGVHDNGLPDGGGWIGLIAGPLGMLFMLVVGWSDGFVRLIERARVSRGMACTLGALALGCMLLLTVAAVRVQRARASAVALAWGESVPPASYPRLDRVAPALALTSQTGAIVTLAELKGRPVLVTFAFAHCTTVCPVIVKHALLAQEQLRGSRAEPAVLIVTLDPWRDVPARLPAIAASWQLPGDGAWVLSGSVAEVETILDTWDVTRTRSATTGDVTHPALLYIVDREGRLAYASTGGVDALVSLVRRL